MKKLLLLILTGLLTMTVLVACGDDEDETATEENEPAETDVTDDENADTESENGTVEDESDSGSGFFEVTEEPQTDLSIGETALVQTSIGSFNLTVNGAEMIDELDGLDTVLEETIILDLTFENVDDEPIIAEDIMMNLAITDNLEHTPNHNAASYYDSIEEFEGEIAPGETRDTQFIAYLYTADEYYFGTSRTTVEVGTQSDVIWVISDEEAR